MALNCGRWLTIFPSATSRLDIPAASHALAGPPTSALQALLEAMAGPSGGLYRDASFGTTQRQWQKCGVLVKQNPWQYQRHSSYAGWGYSRF